MNNLSQRKNHRLQNYDYASTGYYYVTICTHEKQEWFGVCNKGGMVLNPFGQIAEKFWKDMPNHYLDVSLDIFVVMPNHLHGIIIIGKRSADGRPYRDLSTIVGSYKNIVSKTIHHDGNNEFYWQHSFYDTVIRSDAALDKIREYILNNPKQWELDEENPRKAKDEIR